MNRSLKPNRPPTSRSKALHRPRGGLPTALGAGLLVVAGLSACTGDADTNGKPGATGTAGGSSASAGRQTSAKALVDTLLVKGERAPAIASASAQIQLNLGVTRPPVALTAEVVEVRTDAQTTLLHWRLTSTGSDTVKPYGSWLAAPRLTASSSTAELALLDAKANQRLQPFINATGDFTTNCVCSAVPFTVDAEGVDLYASFPALGPDTQTVDLVIPQFPVIKGIAVTRS